MSSEKRKNFSGIEVESTSIRFPSELFKNAKTAATQKQISFNGFVIDAVAQYTQNFGGTSDPPAEEIANMKNVTQYLLRRIGELEGEVRELRGKKSGDDPGQAYPRRSSAV